LGLQLFLNGSHNISVAPDPLSLRAGEICFCAGHKKSRFLVPKSCARNDNVLEWEPASHLFLKKRSLLKFFKGLLELFLCVHDDWTVPGHGFFQRLPGDQEESDSIVAGLHSNFVAAIKDNE
jgi:hypothetical protein